MAYPSPDGLCLRLEQDQQSLLRAAERLAVG